MTLISGLPRVGRTTLLNEWLADHPEARLCHTVSEVRAGGEIFVLDHVEGDEADQIVTVARGLEAAKNPARLLVAPIDLTTAARIQKKLAGMVVSIEVAPLQPFEIVEAAHVLSQAPGPDLNASITSGPTNAMPIDPFRYWLRGGFPESFSADSDLQSIGWRREMLKVLLERDYTEWDVPRSYPLSDVLLYLANQNGSEFDDSVVPFGRRGDFKSGIYVLEQLGLVRRLFNFPAGSNDSLMKKQKLYLRDSGILHAMLGIETSSQLRAHRDVGASFESHAIEALTLAGGDGCRTQFYRAKGNAGDDEIDLVLSFPAQSGKVVAIEIKVGADRSPKAGFYRGCDVVQALDKFVVHAGEKPDLHCEIPRLDLKTAIRRVVEQRLQG